MARMLLLALLLTGCGTSMRREMDVSGSLPKLIGLGGFAPSCLMFCFIENQTSQGDVIRDEGTGEITVRSLTEDQFKNNPTKSKHLSVKPAPISKKGTPP